MAIMVALTVLAAGGALALANIVGGARADLAGSVTVQIVEADDELRNAQAQRAVVVLEGLDGIEDVRRVPDAELSSLVEPWLGSDFDGEVVPLPALIDVRLSGAATQARVIALEDSLAEAAPAARVDAQSDWLAPVFSTFSSLRWLAVGLIALLAFTGAAAVWLAARNALGTNRSTIEVVHLLGGTDSQIARIFQRSVLVDAALGGLLGFALGGAALVVVGAQFALLDSGLVQAGGLGAVDWLLLALIPLAAVAIALLTARMTVMASLRKML